MSFEPVFEPIPNVADLIEQPFGDFLKAVRQEYGLAQADIAQALGISRAAVGQWEAGRTAPTHSNLQAFSDLLRCYKAARSDADGKSVRATDDFLQEETAAPSSATALAGASDAARLDELERFLAFATVWSWRPYVTDMERVHAIQFHPTVQAAKVLPEMVAALRASAAPAGGDDIAGADLSKLAPLGHALRHGVASGGVTFDFALDMYADAITAHRKVLTESSAEGVTYARNVVTHLHNEAVSTASNSEAANMPFRHVDVARARSLAERLSRDLQTAVSDDRSVPGSEEPRRFAERCATLLDMRDFLRGLVGTSERLP